MRGSLSVMEVICEDNCGYVLGQQNLREGRTRKKKKNNNNNNSGKKLVKCRPSKLIQSEEKNLSEQLRYIKGR